jgi:hypothetical protein
MGGTASPTTADSRSGQTNVIEQCGLDGIDIDNEWSNLSENTQSFMNTVGTLQRPDRQSDAEGALARPRLLRPRSRRDAERRHVSRPAPDIGSSMTYGSDW